MPSPEPTQSDKFAVAFKKKTELPDPANIMQDPPPKVLSLYQEARIAVDRFWSTMGNEIMVREPRRVKPYKEYERAV